MFSVETMNKTVVNKRENVFIVRLLVPRDECVE
jgi:hypothetical protein